MHHNGGSGLRPAQCHRRAAGGNIWSGKTMIFRIINDRVYSMHEQHLGRLKCGIAMTDSGEPILMFQT